MDESFSFDTSTQRSISYSAEAPCHISMSSATYRRLLGGTTTFELEVRQGDLKISGDLSLLRLLGKAFRSVQS